MCPKLLSVEPEAAQSIWGILLKKVLNFLKGEGINAN
jgi:hypothetical protein